MLGWCPRPTRRISGSRSTCSRVRPPTRPKIRPCGAPIGSSVASVGALPSDTSPARGTPPELAPGARQPAWTSPSALTVKARRPSDGPRVAGAVRRLLLQDHGPRPGRRDPARPGPRSNHRVSHPSCPLVGHPTSLSAWRRRPAPPSPDRGWRRSAPARRGALSGSQPASFAMAGRVIDRLGDLGRWRRAHERASSAGDRRCRPGPPRRRARRQPRGVGVSGSATDVSESHSQSCEAPRSE